MIQKTDRRGAMVTAIVGVAAVATGSAAKSAQTTNMDSFPLGMEVALVGKCSWLCAFSPPMT